MQFYSFQKALFLANNELDSLEGFPPVPELETIRIAGNPCAVTEEILKITLIIACGQQIERIDTKSTPLSYQPLIAILGVADEEKGYAKEFPLLSCTAIRHGLLLEENSTPKTSAKKCIQFLLEKQKQLTSNKTCKLSEIRIVGDPVEKSVLTAECYFRCKDHIHRDVDASEELSKSLTTGGYRYLWYQGLRDGSFALIPGITANVALGFK